MIDAHQHFWRIGRNDCAWPPPELEPIHRDFQPSDLKAIAQPLGVTGTVLVQSQPSDRDTDYLLDLAEPEPFVQGVVGWADLKAAGTPARIEALAKRSKLKGLRPMLQALPQDDWISDPALDPAFDAMVRSGLVLDALVFTRHLPHLLALARRRPDLTIVVDHAAKPPIAKGDMEPWRADLGRLAREPQVHCKLSGLLTEAGPGQGRAALAPYVAWLIDAFGPERLIWGSDWPVVLLAGGYAEWLEMAQAMTASLGEARGAIFGGNAMRIYRLDQRLSAAAN